LTYAHTCALIINFMGPMGYLPRWRAISGPGDAPNGAALEILRSMIAYLALMIRCAGIVYIIVQVVIWHSFYTNDSWRLAAPAVAAVWAMTVTIYLRRRWLFPLFVYVDSAVYIMLALVAQESVPPAVRDDAFSWLFIAMSGQLVVPAWYAPGAVSLLLAIISPLAYWVGAMLQPVTDARTLVRTTFLLLIFWLVHGYSRRVLYGRATAADDELDRADQAAREQYAILCRNVERRENERLLHDTVLNTLTALSLPAGDAAGDGVIHAVNRCRQDVALIEDALGDPDHLAAGAGRPSGDLPSRVRAVAAGMRARGLNVHVDVEGGGGRAVPAPVAVALANAVREALSNVAAHAGTGEAWVRVCQTALAGAEAPCHVRVTVRDMGAGFDLTRVDRARLGLRRSIAERTAECGGLARIWSRPGQGTVVTLCWPESAP
jgi:signal transduction histidine kinase